jgi:DNA replicative helicase MCM subunit Mcm2 (Cdc46/Mcm family)
MSSPLLSRFDLILLLRDDRDEAWDAQVPCCLVL